MFCILAIKTNKQYEFTVQLLVACDRLASDKRKQRARASNDEEEGGIQQAVSVCVLVGGQAVSVCVGGWYVPGTNQYRYLEPGTQYPGTRFVPATGALDNPLTCQSINAHTYRYLCMVSSLLNSAYTSLALIRAHSSNNRKLLYRW